MSTMCIQMHAMCRISDTDMERSSRILELSILSRISHTDPPSNESESIHSHLYVDDEDHIQDPVYIEYRDGRIYKYDPNDLVDEEALANNRSVQSLMCHWCHPKMSIEYFTGQHDGQRYWYPVYLCLRAVDLVSVIVLDATCAITALHASSQYIKGT